MPLSRVNTIIKIEDILGTMSELFKLGKIRTPRIPKKAESLPATVVREALQWLIAIYQGPFQDVSKIWGLCPKRVWDSYFALSGFENHAEVKLLQQAFKALKKQIRTRPTFFKKGK